MGDDTFFIPFLPDELGAPRIRVRIVTDRGTVTEFSAQLEILQAGRYRAIVRYDTSHGAAHRDILDRDGYNLDKRWLDGVPFDAALTFAIEDLKGRRDSYIRSFLLREGFLS